jgi:hypothetical protein
MKCFGCGKEASGIWKGAYGSQICLCKKHLLDAYKREGGQCKPIKREEPAKPNPKIENHASGNKKGWLW